MNEEISDFKLALDNMTKFFNEGEHYNEPEYFDKLVKCMSKYDD